MIRALFPVLLVFALGARAATNPPLAALQIEVWPEYDRPQALVILKGELAPSTRLPAELSLRIPASSGGPAAVAYAEASGKLLNLPYKHEDAGNFILVRIRPPQRFFHLEFYDRMAMDKPQREYRYAWPGDMAVERVSVLVKEPAASSNLAVQPSLEFRGQSPDGMTHRAAQLGALKAGQSLPIEIRYTKTDTRPSTEIIGSTASALGAPPQAPGAQPDAPTPAWPLVLVAAGAVVLTGSIAALVWRRRRVRPAGNFCRKCGRATNAGDRFCANCGAALA